MSIKSDNDESILSRWSRIKLESEPAVESEVEVSPAEQVDPPLPEELPVWQQPDIDPAIKKQALSALFRQPEFNVVDRLNDYDEDFTSFSKLGNVITAEMKRMLALTEQKKRPTTHMDEGEKVNLDQQQPENDADVNDNDNEDKPLA